MDLPIFDPKIAELIKAEEARQYAELNLIASENYTPAVVREVTSSVLTNKYAEGYPGKRYYGGCRLVDEVEQLAIDRACTLFGAEHANVQPHAGSQANMGVYTALLQPGDTILGMSLAMGGHLTHGHPINFSGSIYQSVQYGVHPETEMIDYDQVEQLAHEHKPKLIIVGASAYSRIIDFARFAQIAQSVNAYLLADIAHIAGLVAARLHPSPFPHADVVSSTTHKTLRGPRSGFILSKACYKEAIDRALMPGLQGGPFMHVIAAKALTFKLAGEDDFVHYQTQVIANAKKMVDEFKHRGYRIVANGTDNHLFIIDLRDKGLNGKKAELILEQAGITVSRSCIPFDTEKPWITSGIRIGTPAITTRNMGEEQAVYLVELIDDALRNAEDPMRLTMIRKQIAQLCTAFPIPDIFSKLPERYTSARLHV